MKEYLIKLGFPTDDHHIMAAEAACITGPEIEADPEACKRRIQGALEEMEDFDL